MLKEKPDCKTQLALPENLVSELLKYTFSALVFLLDF